MLERADLDEDDVLMPLMEVDIITVPRSPVVLELDLVPERHHMSIHTVYDSTSRVRLKKYSTGVKRIPRYVQISFYSRRHICPICPTFLTSAGQ